MKLKTILLAFATGSSVSMAAVTIGSDNASNYAGDWTNGSDAGTAATFGAWSFNNSATNSGNFVADSTQLNGNVNTNNVSFGMFANGAGFANANRDFNANELGVGQTFSLSLAVNFRNGNKGFSLFDGAVEIFNFNVGSDNYVVNNTSGVNGSIGNSYDSNTVFALSFNQSSITGGTWSITRSGGISDLDTGTYTGVADNFRLYIANTDGGTPNNDFYFNNLTVVPEPSAALLGAIGSLILLRRRK